MERQNLVLVFDHGMNKVLMCKRSKAPYQGLLNLVGGKVEYGEDSFSAAYRELEEETSISDAMINLTHLMDLTYYLHNRVLEVYVGRMTEDAPVSGNENELVWLPVQDLPACREWLAGDGNVEHIIGYTLHLVAENRPEL